MIEITKTKVVILRCVSILSIIFALLFSYTWKSGYTMGDAVLTNIGLKAWSDGVHGTHYTIIYSLVMMLAAFLVYAITTKKWFVTLLYFICGFSIIFIGANIMW